MKLEKIEFICSAPDLKSCPKGDIPEFAFIGRSNVGKSSLINMLADHKGLAKVSGTPGKTRLINFFKVDAGYRIKDPGCRIQDKIILKHESWTGSEATLDRERSDPGSGVKRPWFLVDLPGFGFARLSKQEREKFEGMIKNYLDKRENLVCTFLLIDSRLPAQKIDLEFMSWLGDHEIPFLILFTKTDKLSKTQCSKNLKEYQKSLSESWEELPRIILTSAETKLGREEVLAFINELR